MICITFISAFNTLPTMISILSFFAMERVTRHILSVKLLVSCWLVLLYTFELLSDVILCDRIWNKLLRGSATESLNIIFLWSVGFVLVDLVLLTWGVNFQLYIYQFSVSFQIPLPFRWTDSWLMNRGAWICWINRCWRINLYVILWLFPISCGNWDVCSKSWLCSSLPELFLQSPFHRHYQFCDQD